MLLSRLHREEDKGMILRRPPAKIAGLNILRETVLWMYYLILCKSESIQFT